MSVSVIRKASGPTEKFGAELARHAEYSFPLNRPARIRSGFSETTAHRQMPSQNRFSGIFRCGYYWPQSRAPGSNITYIYSYKSQKLAMGIYGPLKRRVSEFPSLWIADRPMDPSPTSSIVRDLDPSPYALMVSRSQHGSSTGSSRGRSVRAYAVDCRPHFQHKTGSLNRTKKSRRGPESPRRAKPRP